jgi:hypothetical protein
MAITLYKEHLVVSSVKFHPDEQRWIPTIIISWKTGTKHHFHSIRGLPTRYKQEAENLAIEAAKAWVDQRL